MRKPQSTGDVVGLTPRGWNGLPAAFVVALLFAGMAVTASRYKGPAYDETGHVTAGTSYLLFGDHRLQPENGLLPQLLVGLPGWMAEGPPAEAGGRFPSRESAGWAGSDVWVVGNQYLYESGLDWRALLLSARALMAAVAAGLGLLVYAWARRLHGPAGGMLSLLLYAFSPTLLAHGALATSDLCAAAALLLSVFALTAVLEQLTTLRAVCAGAVLAVLFLCKGSALLVIPVAGVLFVLRALRNEPLPIGWISPRGAVAGRLQRIGVLAALAFTLALCTWAGIWAGYGFRYPVEAEGQAPPESLYWGGWPHIEASGTVGVPSVLWMRDHRVLPEAWLYGLGFVLAHSSARDAFLDGKYNAEGFPDFFPRVALYKTPPAELAMLALAAAATIVSWRGRRNGSHDVASASGAFRTAPLWLLIAAVGAAALTSHLNVGHRHLLPLYPAAFILAGAAGAWLSRSSRWMAALVLAVLGWQVFDSLATRPHYLAYFSPVIGGPSQGYRHLVDSSLDWGQDLPGLADYLAQQRRSPTPPAEVYLAYFGTGSPDAEGIVARHFPFVPDRNRHAEMYPLGPGLYCVSATLLQSVYMPIKRWSPQAEAEWLACRADIERLEAAQSDAALYAKVLAEHGEAAWNSRLHDYEQLRFARLCAYLRRREPDAEIGYSILVYRLSEEQAITAIYGPPPED